jgi:glycosyltransferase involved in cell wall biosynthesis
MNKLSVLIPTYNRAEFLGYCLDSLTKQTFKDFCVIIYDDGSTDNTKKVVNEYSKILNIEYVKGETNKGVGFSRNELLKRVKTDFFCWQDSDDLSQPDRFEKQLKNIDGLDICFSWAYFFKHPNKNRRGAYQIDVSRYDSREGLYKNMLFATGMFDKKCAEYKFNSRLRKKEDVDWLCKLIKAGMGFACSNEYLYYIRRHEGRLTTTNDNNIRR